MNNYNPQTQRPQERRDYTEIPDNHEVAKRLRLGKLQLTHLDRELDRKIWRNWR